MISTKDVMEWLKSLFPEVPKWGNGLINRNESKAVGIYTRQNGRVQPKTIACKPGYGIKSISLLVHWGKYTSGCEEEANRIYETFQEIGTDEPIGGYSCWIICQREPVLLGRDEHGIHEAVIDFDIYFRR